MKRYATITKRFEFEAAHHLEHHLGKCRRPHGHSYVLEVSVRGPIRAFVKDGDELRTDFATIVGQPSNVGMVMDFGDLSELVKRAVLARVDHYDLNEACDGISPTAENLAHWIWTQIENHAPILAIGFDRDDTGLVKIRLWETRSGSVTITRDDR